MMNDFKFENMLENYFASDITEQRLLDIDKERIETMRTKEFNDWCTELKVSASYIDKRLHTDNRYSMMEGMDHDEWIATFKRTNFIKN